MTFEQLLYTEVLSHCHSMQEAANTLHITKSGLSLAVSQLEEEIGVTLFVRTSKGTYLTEKGIQMMASITTLLKDRNVLLHTADALTKSAGHETISLRYMNTLFPSFVLPFFEHFQHSDITLDIHCSDFRDIVDNVSAHAIDAGFIAADSSFQPDPQFLHYEEICRTKIVMFCRPDNSIVQKAQLTAENLKNQKFCLYSDSFHDQIFERLQFLCGPLKLIMKTDDTWAIHEAVFRCNAVGLGRIVQGKLSRDTIMQDVKTVDLSHIINDNASLGWLTNPKYSLSPACRKMLQEITSDIQKKSLP